MPIVVPDACTLPTVERPLRRAEFDAVAPARPRMRLTGPSGLSATVRDQTARETECCSFFTFTVTPEPADDGEMLILDVEVPARYAEQAGTIRAGQRS